MSRACADKTALLLTYSDAAKKYCEAVTELHERIGIVSRTEFNHLHQTAEDNRLTVEAARTAMEDHIRRHGC